LIFHKYELLAPVGSWDMLRAAVENGADAVYFGLKEHNARMRAENFDISELEKVIEYCHHKDVNAYMVFNTLIYNEEIEAAIQTFKTVVEKGIDGVIIQDVGVGKIFHQISPEIPLHASTQMTVTSVESAQFVKNLGYSRVILARELNLEEITRISKNVDIEIETFVHGAICMAYSGQCLTSSFWGGRSANRGECAQACRLPYKLNDYGEEKELNKKDKKYLLSPGDLNLIHHIKELVEAGVMTFKIEGRLKSAEYVASTVRAYRKALDHILYEKENFSKDDEVNMEKIFSRGFIPYYFDGKKNHRRTVHGEFPKSRGLEIGKVLNYSNGKVSLKLWHNLRLGDGLVFAASDEEIGGFVNKIFLKGKSVKEAQKNEKIEIPFSKISKKSRAWKSLDQKLNKELRASFENQKEQKKIPLNFKISGKIGEKALLKVSDFWGTEVKIESEEFLEKATSNPLTKELCEAKLSRLGSTDFYLQNFDFNIQENSFISPSELNQLRRNVIEKLIPLRIQKRKNSYKIAQIPVKKEKFRPENNEDQLKIVVRTIDQVKAACETDVDVIVFDFNDLKFFQKAASICEKHKKEYHIATPRIQKPKEEGFFRVIEKLSPKGVLIRNLGSLEYFKNSHDFVITGDYSLNITNDFSKSEFENYGMQRLTPSYEMDVKQLGEMISDLGENIEMAIHYYIPAFHSEYCHWVGNLVLTGKAKPFCGELCQSRPISVTDRKGIEHPIQSDAFCRNTVFNGQPVSYFQKIQELKLMKINSFRIEVVYETAEEVKKLINFYRSEIMKPKSINFSNISSLYNNGVQTGKF
jgi:putative protease